MQKDIDELSAYAEKKAEEVENFFIETHAKEEELPVFDFAINLNESD